MKIILFAVLLLSCIDIYQSADPKAPNLKLGLSYKQMNLAIDYIVAPLLKQTLSNLTMPGPMLLNLTYEGVTVTLNATDLYTTNFSQNWDATNLYPNNENGFGFDLEDATINLGAHIEIDDIPIIGSLGGNLGMFLQNMTLNIKINAVENATHWVSLEVEQCDVQQEINFQHFKVFRIGQLAISTGNIVIDNVIRYVEFEFGEQIMSLLSATLLDELNNLLGSLTSEPLEIKVNDNLTLGAIFQGIPQNIKNKEELLLSLLLSGSNGDEETFQENPKNNQALNSEKLKTQDDTIELMLTSDFLNLAQWSVEQIMPLTMVIDNTTMGPDPMIQITTTGLNILFQNITAYGANKGVYIEVSEISKTPHLFLRDGRLVAVFDISIGMWVDKDGTNYPQEGLAKCSQTTCEEFINFTSKLYAAAMMYNQDQSTIAATVMNAQLLDLKILEATVTTDQFELFLNNLISSLLGTINQLTKKGVVNPLIGQFNINEMKVRILENTFIFDLAFQDGL